MKKMATNEMRAWLEEKIARDTEWLKHIEILDALDVDETSPSYSETKYNIGIYQAILAALEVKVTRAEIEKFVEGSLCRAMDSKKMADAVQCFLRSIELVALAERPESVMEANRGRDKLWCEALVHELDTRDVEKVTRYFNFIRPIKETTDAD